MDDFVLWENELEGAKEKRDAVTEFLTRTLNLTLKLADVDTVDRGVPFLGFLIKPWATGTTMTTTAGLLTGTIYPVE